ncbi:MAG: hypothetical protein CMN79_03115 [Spirochaetales bacterium]|jgi:hypothetical protein|nr:hypothetical protein [Spirochaetales bacterium]|tara:strand:+ start:228 stop:1229 length:1002 start_codon:yes stop_codon:yes gene_type:complete
MTRPDRISFVVVTNGADHEKLDRLILSASYNGESHLKDYQINVCGDLSGYSIREEKGQKINFIPAKDSAAEGKLGEMRNLGCEHSNFDVICILDDDFILSPDWAKNIPHSYFDVMTTQVRLPDGGRFWDHACFQSKEKGHIILNPEENDDNLYMSGGTAWMMKKKVFDKVQWGSAGIYDGVQSLEEYRKGNHNEDTFFSKQCRENNFLIVHNHDSVSFHDDGRYTNIGKLCNRRRGDRDQSWIKSVDLSFSAPVLAEFCQTLFQNGFQAESNDVLRYGLANFPNNYDLVECSKKMEIFAGVLPDSRYSPDGDESYHQAKKFYSIYKESLPIIE